jgi:hypothetical protein
MSFTTKRIVGRNGLSPLPADTLGTGVKTRRIAPTTSALSQPVHAGSVERTTSLRMSLARLLQRPYGESLARPGVFKLAATGKFCPLPAFQYPRYG